MLAYHPAKDPYHGGLRMIELLDRAPEQKLRWERLKLLDFYYVFPSFVLESLRFPREQVKWRKRLELYGNEYMAATDKFLALKRLNSIQESASAMLVGKGLLDKEAYLGGEALLKSDRLPDEIESIVRRRQAANSELVMFLTSVLGELSWEGVGGLKERTGLLEYRYDLT